MLDKDRASGAVIGVLLVLKMLALGTCIAYISCVGCNHLIPPPLDERPSFNKLKALEKRQLQAVDKALGVVWYDPSKTVFRFGTRVRITKGFYRGFEGHVKDWDSIEGYTVEVSGVLGTQKGQGEVAIYQPPTLRGVESSAIEEIEAHVR